jgi:hypothetical protein
MSDQALVASVVEGIALVPAVILENVSVDVAFMPTQTGRATPRSRLAKSDKVQLDGSNQEFQASMSGISTSA